MDIKEVYSESIKGQHEWLSLLIEFLVFEKGVISFEDDQQVLDLYFKPNNQQRMNKLLLEYRNKLESSEGRVYA